LADGFIGRTWFGLLGWQRATNRNERFCGVWRTGNTACNAYSPVLGGKVVAVLQGRCGFGVPGGRFYPTTCLTPFADAVRAPNALAAFFFFILSAHPLYSLLLSLALPGVWT